MQVFSFLRRDGNATRRVAETNNERQDEKAGAAVSV